MSIFVTRVELHGVLGHEAKEYRLLHDAMAKRGFARTITSDNGGMFHLPPAEYHRRTDLPIDSVFNDALATAQSVQAAASVLVAEATRIRWHNLETVKKQPSHN